MAADDALLAEEFLRGVLPLVGDDFGDVRPEGSQSSFVCGMSRILRTDGLDDLAPVPVDAIRGLRRRPDDLGEQPGGEEGPAKPATMSAPPPGRPLPGPGV
jgi:hypothetical protein